MGGVGMGGVGGTGGVGMGGVGMGGGLEQAPQSAGQEWQFSA